MFTIHYNDQQQYKYMMNSNHLYKDDFTDLIDLLKTNPTPFVVKHWYNKHVQEDVDGSLILDHSIVQYAPFKQTKKSLEGLYLQCKVIR